MALAPDVIIQLVLPCPPQDQINVILTLAQEAFHLPLSQGVCSNNTNVTPNANVLSIGLWNDADGFTDAQRRTQLLASSFISGNRTAALLVTTSYIKTKVQAAWNS